MYMESRKMVLINLFAGQEQTPRHREQTCGHSGRRRGWDEFMRVALKHIHYHMEKR